MKLFSTIFLLTLLFLASSCGKERAPVYEVPSKVQPFVDNFESEAAERNEELDIDDLVVEYMTNLMPDEVEAAGVCFFETENTGPIIHLDTTSQNWQGSDFTKEELVFHELGHCILGRGHRNTLLSAGGYASIMKAEGSP
ncbi:hypothetical protein N8482_03230, partial [Chitinophagales bacterium]|nr:hypothetical protein [Chitinophagales bacterium]